MLAFHWGHSSLPELERVVLFNDRIQRTFTHDGEKQEHVGNDTVYNVSLVSELIQCFVLPYPGGCYCVRFINWWTLLFSFMKTILTSKEWMLASLVCCWPWACFEFISWWQFTFKACLKLPFYEEIWRKLFKNGPKDWTNIRIFFLIPPNTDEGEGNRMNAS